jgi:hypothetical protein
LELDGSDLSPFGLSFCPFEEAVRVADAAMDAENVFERAQLSTKIDEKK